MAEAPVVEERLSRADIVAALLSLFGEGSMKALALFARTPDSYRFVGGHHITPPDDVDLPIGADLATWSLEHAEIPDEGLDAHVAPLERNGREEGRLCVLLATEGGSELIYTEAFQLFTEHEAEMMAETRRRLELESEIETERERLRALFDASGNAIVIIRRETGRIQYANTGLEHLAEMSAEDAIGKSLWQLDAFSDSQLLREAFGQAAQIRQPVPLRLTRKNAAPVALSLSTAPVDFETYCVVLADISDTVSSRTRLLEGEKSRVMRSLLGKFVHDITNNITAISGFAHILRTSADTSEKTKESVDQVVAEAKRARELVQQLAEMVIPTFRSHARVDVRALIASAVDFASLSARPIGIEVLAEPAGEAPIIKGDRYALLCALDEAILNALDTFKAAGTGGRVVVRTQAGPSSVSIEIEDDAGGAPDPKEAFEPFYTTRKPPDHLGLGLNMIRGVAESHRGCANLQNTDKGAILRITLATA